LAAVVGEIVLEHVSNESLVEDALSTRLCFFTPETGESLLARPLVAA
jgi:hypothetical protein